MDRRQLPRGPKGNRAPLRIRVRGHRPREVRRRIDPAFITKLGVLGKNGCAVRNQVACKMAVTVHTLITPETVFAALDRELKRTAPGNHLRDHPYRERRSPGRVGVVLRRMLGPQSQSVAGQARQARRNSRVAGGVTMPQLTMPQLIMWSLVAMMLLVLLVDSNL